LNVNSSELASLSPGSKPVFLNTTTFPSDTSRAPLSSERGRKRKRERERGREREIERERERERARERESEREKCGEVRGGGVEVEG